MLISAGILLYRRRKVIEVLLVHPGGPFFAKKDEGSWSIPKGLPNADEETETAAKREFLEETGFSLPPILFPLPPIKQKSGKTIVAWAAEGDADPAKLVSNSFEMEWPPRSGKKQTYPEVDRAAWFELAAAREKILKGQLPLLMYLEELI